MGAGSGGFGRSLFLGGAAPEGVVPMRRAPSDSWLMGDRRPAPKGVGRANLTGARAKWRPGFGRRHGYCFEAAGGEAA